MLFWSTWDVSSQSEDLLCKLKDLASIKTFLFEDLLGLGTAEASLIFRIQYYARGPFLHRIYHRFKTIDLYVRSRHTISGDFR